MDPRLSVAWRRGGWIRGLAVPVVFATSIPIAFVNPNVAKYWWILLATQRWVTRRWAPGSDEPFGPAERAG
jgi:Na+-transporting NADH:ubiquinone oxidoreductase subunit NqrB